MCFLPEASRGAFSNARNGVLCQLSEVALQAASVVTASRDGTLKCWDIPANEARYFVATSCRVVSLAMLIVDQHG